MSNYTLAGCETIWNYLKHGKQDWVSLKDLQDFLQQAGCTRYLHSFGQNFQEGKFDAHLRGEVKMLKVIRELYEGCTLIYDSGGYQISTNKLKRNDLPRFMDLFYDEFIGENYEDLDKFFILDLPPGPGCEAFKDFNDLKQWNLESYLRAAALPQKIKDKCVYIHHFRTPKLWEVFTSIMRDNDLFNEFKFHGTGGLVANQATDTKISYIISVFPLVQLLKEAVKYKRTELDFHILGNATFKDILFYHLIEKHVFETHGITLKISFDSSGLYGEVMTGRTIRTINDDFVVSKIGLREAELDNRFIGDKSFSNREKLSEVINQMCEKTGLKAPPEDIMMKVYYINEKDNKSQFHPIARLYIALFYLYSYSRTTDLSKPAADHLYGLYKNDTEKFSKGLGELTRRANFGKLTRKQKLKTYGFDNTLDLITTLDEEKCFSLVRKFLGRDEFDLDTERKILTI